MTRSLFSSTQEPLKLDLSFCGVASTYIYELNTNAIFISGILELHLGGNPIMQEVCLISDYNNFIVYKYSREWFKFYRCVNHRSWAFDSGALKSVIGL